MKKTFLLILLLAVSLYCEEKAGTGGRPQEALQQKEKKNTTGLFIIERSKNANIVHYDAKLTIDGKIDKSEPVVAYWELLAKDGARQELTWLDKKAYGFKVEPEKPGGQIQPGVSEESYILALVPYRDRDIKVYLSDGKPKAEIIIASKPAFLEKIYINSKESITGPKVLYMELFGKGLKSGAPLYEKIIPKK